MRILVAVLALVLGLCCSSEAQTLADRGMVVRWLMQSRINIIINEY
jgi:uncharacterized protein YerC